MGATIIFPEGLEDSPLNIPIPLNVQDGIYVQGEFFLKKPNPIPNSFKPISSVKNFLKIWPLGLRFFKKICWIRRAWNSKSLKTLLSFPRVTKQQLRTNYIKTCLDQHSITCFLYLSYVLTDFIFAVNHMTSKCLG